MTIKILAGNHHDIDKEYDARDSWHFEFSPLVLDHDWDSIQWSTEHFELAISETIFVKDEPVHETGAAILNKDQIRVLRDALNEFLGE